MSQKHPNLEAYYAALPQDRQAPMSRLRAVINDHLPEGFEETLNYNMPGWVVPHSVYPPGYHCSPELPLPFMNIASQKNFIGVYHMGIYASPELLAWFQDAYASVVPTKLDMGKSCIRLKKVDQIPYDLVGELAGKMTTGDWVSLYEAAVKR